MTIPRVIFATTVFERAATGPAVYARYLWDALAKARDVEFHVVSPEFTTEHPRLHPAGGTGREVYERVASLARALAEEEPDRTIVHGNTAHGMAAFVDYPGRWIVQVNDYELAEFSWRAWGKLFSRGPRWLASRLWRRRQEAKVLPAATMAVCNSDYTRQTVLNAYGLDPDRAVTIHKAVDTSAFARPASLPADPLPDRPAGGRLVLVGSHWHMKGLDVLVRALPEIAASCEAVSLAVAGHDASPSAARIRRLVDHLGLAERVTSLGHVDRSALARLLWHSDVLVLPSRQEAFGVAALEAMAAGVAVVASDTGGLAELLRGGQDGVLAPVGSVAELARAIADLLTDAPRRTALAQAGPTRAAAFSVERMVEQVKNLYRTLASPPHPSR